MNIGKKDNQKYNDNGSKYFDPKREQEALAKIPEDEICTAEVVDTGKRFRKQTDTFKPSETKPKAKATAKATNNIVTSDETNIEIKITISKSSQVQESSIKVIQNNGQKKRSATLEINPSPQKRQKPIKEPTVQARNEKDDSEQTNLTAPKRQEPIYESVPESLTTVIAEPIDFIDIDFEQADQNIPQAMEGVVIEKAEHPNAVSTETYHYQSRMIQLQSLVKKYNDKTEENSNYQNDRREAQELSTRPTILQKRIDAQGPVQTQVTDAMVIEQPIVIEQPNETVIVQQGERFADQNIPQAMEGVAIETINNHPITPMNDSTQYIFEFNQQLENLKNNLRIESFNKQDHSRFNIKILSQLKEIHSLYTKLDINFVSSKLFPNELFSDVVNLVIDFSSFWIKKNRALDIHTLISNLIRMPQYNVDQKTKLQNLQYRSGQHVLTANGSGKSKVCYTLSIIDLNRKEYERALQHIQQGLSSLEENNDSFLKTALYVNLSATYIYLGKFEAVVMAAQNGLRNSNCNDAQKTCLQTNLIDAYLGIIADHLRENRFLEAYNIAVQIDLHKCNDVQKSAFFFQRITIYNELIDSNYNQFDETKKIDLLITMTLDCIATSRFEVAYKAAKKGLKMIGNGCVLDKANKANKKFLLILNLSYACNQLGLAQESYNLAKFGLSSSEFNLQRSSEMIIKLHAILAVACAKLKKYDEVIHHARTGYQIIDSQSIEAFLALAHAYNAKKLHQEAYISAKKGLEELEKLGSKDKKIEFIIEIYDACRGSKQYEEGKTVIENALEEQLGTTQQKIEMHIALSSFYFVLQKYQEALQVIKTGLEIPECTNYQKFLLYKNMAHIFNTDKVHSYLQAREAGMNAFNLFSCVDSIDKKIELLKQLEFASNKTGDQMTASFAKELKSKLLQQKNPVGR